MTTDGNPTNTPPAAPTPPVAAAPPPPADPAVPPAEAAPPAPVTLEALLEKGEPVAPDALKPLLDQRDQQLIARVESDLRRRADEERARERAQQDQNAAAAEDIAWAQRIYEEEDSPDPQVAANARNARRENEQRFNRGRALLYERDSSKAKGEAVSEYMGPIWEGVKAAGFAELFQAGGALHSGESEAMRAANGNWMVAAMKSAEQIGYERGKNESANAADLNGRIAEGVQGAPNLTTPPADRNADLWAGIDRSKPGAYAQYQQRLADRQRAIPGR